MPFRCAYLGQETLHLSFLGDQLPVEVARIPIDQYAADVEDHSADSWRLIWSHG
jgi:hypothetical protein